MVGRGLQGTNWVCGFLRGDDCDDVTFAQLCEDIKRSTELYKDEILLVLNRGTYLI
jgi:hypothetical protein